MANDEFTNVKLYAEHEPDPPPDPNHPAPHTVEQGAGFIVVGADVNGVRIPLGSFKAGKLLPLIQAAKKAKSKTTSDDE